MASGHPQIISPFLFLNFEILPRLLRTFSAVVIRVYIKQGNKIITRISLFFYLFVDWDVAVAGYRRLEVGHCLQGQVHVEVQHAADVHPEYEQHFERSLHRRVGVDEEPSYILSEIRA